MRFLNAITAGDSIDFTFALADNESVTDWVCTIYVKKKKSDANTLYFAPRIIAASGNSWPGYLTGTETSTLAAGTYYLIAEMVNATNDERQTEFARIRITDTWTP